MDVWLYDGCIALWRVDGLLNGWLDAWMPWWSEGCLSK